MSFANPGLLIALLLGAIPVIVYYLIRFRALRIAWGATYILERALARLRKRLNLDQLILLALRTLAVLALVLAFARPLSQTVRGAGGGGTVHRIVVVDASYSMLAGAEGARTWDQARTTLTALVGTWGRGERWSLLQLGGPPRWVVDDQAIDTPAASQAVIAALAPVEAAAALAPALALVAARAAGRETEIYLVTDDQATTWKDVAQAPWPSDGTCRAYWICPRRPEVDNLAVERLELSHTQVLAGHPCRAFVRVRHYGREPVEGVELEVLVDGAFQAREPVALLPGQETWVSVEVTPTQAGSHSVTVRLPADGLDFDNALSAGLEVVDTLTVGVLRDPSRTGKFTSAWGFLEVAANVLARPRESGARGPSGVFRTVLLEDDLADGIPAGTDVVLLDGGTILTPRLARQLQDYVRCGGGLLLAPDETVDLARWNDLLGEAGLLPARLLGARRELLGGERYRTLGRAGFKAPALRAFETADDGDIGRLRLYTWVELGDPAAGAVVLAEFADGQPFVVRARSELGAVVLMGAGLNSRNNNLLVREFAYPVLVNLFSETASGRLYPRTVGLAEPIRLRLEAGDPPAAVQFEMPGLEPVALQPQDAPAGPVVTWLEGVTRSGLGSLLLSWRERHTRVWFGVQGARVDSDLTPLSPDRRERVMVQLELAQAGNWEQLHALLEARYRGAEWHPGVIVGVLALLLGEMLMQRRFL